MSTVSSMNAAELPDMIGLAARIGADVFAFGRYCPTKGQRLEEFHMEPLEYRALLLACQKRIDELTAAGCPMPADLIRVEECAAALYKLLTGKEAPAHA